LIVHPPDVFVHVSTDVFDEASAEATANTHVEPPDVYPLPLASSVIVAVADGDVDPSRTVTAVEEPVEDCRRMALRTKFPAVWSIAPKAGHLLSGVRKPGSDQKGRAGSGRVNEPGGCYSTLSWSVPGSAAISIGRHATPVSFAARP
jgi:hypothetical protein